MTISSEAVKIGQKELKRKYPVVEGDTLGTTKIHEQKRNLVAEKESKVSKKQRTGI